MTDPRFAPSASLLLAIALCWPEFAVGVPSTIESLTALLPSWGGEGAAGASHSGTETSPEAETPAD